MTAPLIAFGVLSDWYIGTQVERAPIPRPAVKRPIANWAQWLVEEISITTPIMYQNAEKEMVYLRPMRSEIGAEIRHPMRVPMERRPTMVPWRTALNSPFSPNLCKKFSWARKPEEVRESGDK